MGAALKKDLLNYCQNQTWTFAKTMKTIPHEYIIQRNQLQGGMFRKLCKAIAEFGIGEKFYTKTYYYLYLGDYKYWLMVPPEQHEGAWLINRAKIMKRNKKNENTGSISKRNTVNNSPGDETGY